MNLPETNEQGIENELETKNNNALFVSDSGELPFDTRRALVQ